MFDNVLQGVYNRLKPIAEKNRRYSKYKAIVWVLFVIIYAVVAIVTPFIQIIKDLGYYTFTVIWVPTWAILFLLTLIVVGRKSRKYHLTVDDWSIFLTCSILENLEQYSNASKRNNQQLAKEYKNMAAQDARDLLLTIENDWEVGDFKLVQVFNEAISEFKKSLQTRLIPNLEQKKLDKETFDKVESVAYNIAYFMLNPDLPTLNHLNDSTFQQLTEHPLSEANLLSRWWNYIQVNRILRHTLVLIGIGILALFSFLMGNYIGATIDTKYATAFIVFATLAAAYIATMKKESPRTSESK